MLGEECFEAAVRCRLHAAGEFADFDVQQVFLMSVGVANTFWLSESVALNRQSPIAAHLASDAAPYVANCTFFIDGRVLRAAGSP